MAIELDDIRSAVRQRRDRYQDEGRFDRTRLVEAFKGDQTYRYKDVKEDDTSLSASLVVDLSGSMDTSVENGDLYTAVATVSQAMTQLDMPHEVRAFSGQSIQLKAMDDQQLDDARVGLLASESLGSTRMHETTLLAATALMGREERNKLGLFLTDGALGDHEETREALEAMRKEGVITFGVFYGDPDTYTVQRLDELYGATRGKCNWVAIGDLSEYSKKVGRRIAELFNELD